MKLLALYSMAAALSERLTEITGIPYPVFINETSGGLANYEPAPADSDPNTQAPYVLQTKPVQPAKSDDEMPFPGAYVNVHAQLLLIKQPMGLQRMLVDVLQDTGIDAKRVLADALAAAPTVAAAMKTEYTRLITL